MSNSTDQKYNPLESQLIGQFDEISSGLVEQETAKISSLRASAMDYFKQNGLPTPADEKWRNTDLEGVYEEDFALPQQPLKVDKNVDEMFYCEVHNFDTEIISLLNGWHLNKDAELRTLNDGIIMGSLREAMKQYPELIEKYYGEIANTSENGFTAINTALAVDGVFIYVPDNVVADKALQMIKMIDLEETLYVQNRNLIILGKNSQLTLMHCDDSINHHPSLSNTVTEVYLHENAGLEMYKLQNLNNNSALVNSTYVQQEANSRLQTNSLTFNGGLIRNNVHVKLDGQGADAKVYGLYLMDDEQHVDNQVYIDHAKPNCTSDELFKGILDDHATAVFNGYIHVARDAQKTSAFQQNNNLLLKPTAKVDTMPFLEIYADDVKCSHGATVGQLDEEAMFYIRQRGISQDNARLLLMYAFAADIIDHISIDALKVRIDDMVKKRLRGELSICEKCVLHCGQPEKEYHFDIDLSKI